MGTSSGPHEQQVREKVQKGWLSRWTRKQWSRHWFVLKNGSITYYRGPAAELCSFLDGVLDLSLIKHIEVPQQVEESRPALHHHASSQSPPSAPNQNYAFNYQQNLSQYHQQQQQQHHQHQQQNLQTNSHFDFTLKMWNGECHLLSATSAAERQSWLAAIHSCGSFDDSTSDSSASSDSSMSAKSTDIGKPTGSLVGATRNTSVSATSTTPAVSQTHNPFLNSYQAQQQQQREAELSLEHLALKLKSVVRRSNAGRYQEQEVDQSVEPKQQQLQQNSSQIREQQQTKQTSQTPLLKPMFLTKVIDDNENGDNDDEQHPGQDEDDTTDGSENADEESDQMDDDDDDDDDDDESNVSDQEAPKMPDRGENQAHKRNLNSPKSTSEPKLLKRDGELRKANVEQPPVGGHDEEAEMLSIKSDNSSAFSTAEMDGAQPATSSATGLLKMTSNDHRERTDQQSSTVQRQKKRVTFDLSNQDLSKYSRIDRDLSSSSASSSEESDASSPSNSSDDEAEEEPQDERLKPTDSEPQRLTDRLGGATKLSSDSISSVSSSEADTHDNNNPARPKTDNSGDKLVTSSSNANSADRLIVSGEDEHSNADTEQLFDLEHIREIEQRRKSELKKQLSYSHQKANDEDEDSTCELVRRMIERRRLRLLGKQQQEAHREIDETPAEERCELNTNLSRSCVDQTDQSKKNSSAILSCRMDTSEEPAEQRVDSSSSSDLSLDKAKQLDTEASSPEEIEKLKQLGHIGQLEDRLKSAQFNIDQLERRLEDSYLSYNQLEFSYKQLQLQLIECQQLHSSSLIQTQTKIDALTRELEASELKLLEAKEKLLKYEEHLAKWQLQSQPSAHQTDLGGEPNSTTTTSPPAAPNQSHRLIGASKWAHQKTTNWLMKNSSYLTSVAHHNLSKNDIGPHVLGTLHHRNHHQQERIDQPRLLIHQLKQALSINQQQLSLKLLNQSKQIQRKLNQLESKVDQIQASDCSHLTNTRSRGLTELEIVRET